MKTYMKQCTGQAGALRRKLLPLLIAGCFGAGPVSANPVGPQVVNGQVGFATQGNTLSITNSPGSIINWQSFSINQGEITRFIQQNSGSAVLNRITGQDPSQILGALQSNGHVFLVNPNGILFGQGAQIDVNGLVASTLNISNEDFLAGRLNFVAGGTAGDLKNQGSITTPSGGRVYLIAPNVENSGIITSPQGEVLLAAGRSVQLVDSADPDLQVVVSAPDDRALNLGSVITQGGKAGIYGALINQRGIVSADSAVVGENGKIVFKASGDTLLEAGSRTSATGVGQGGEIHVLGQRVGLTGDATVDASGQTGGGTVLIGGDYQGKGSVPNAQRSYVGADAVIRADATDAGDGGKVVVWSDQTTQAYGTISVRGGPRAGNGGLVETSGHHLDVAGVRIDASAAHGHNGDWLLDPYDIEVVASGGNTDLTAFDQFADLPSSGPSQVSAGAISSASANVMLQATHDITFTDPIYISLPGVGLTAQAGNSIYVNSAINSNGGAVSLSGAAINVGGAGSINVGNAAISLTADDMNLGGVAGSLIAGSGRVTLESSNPRPIDLGTDSSGYLGLTMAELNTITADKVTIGSEASTAIRISAPLSPSFASLSLISTGTITQAPGAWLGGRSLRLEGSAITLLEANPTGVIAGSTTDGDFQYRSVNTIAVSNVDDRNGITVPGNASIKLISDMNINQSAPLIGGGLGLKAKASVFLTDSGNAIGNVVADLVYGGAGSGDMALFSSTDLNVASGMMLDGAAVSGISSNNMGVTLKTGAYRTLSINAPISAGSGAFSHVDLQADKLALNSTVTASEASIRPASTGRPITVGTSTCHDIDSGDESCLTVTQLSNVVAQTIGIGQDATSGGSVSSGDGMLAGLSVLGGANVTGPIYVEGITSGVSSLTDRSAVTTRIGLLSGAGVSQGSALGIDVQDLGAIAGASGAVNLTNPNNKVVNLAGTTAGGGFSFANAGDLTITTLSGDALRDGGGYKVAGINAGSGDVNLYSSGAINGGMVTGGNLALSAGRGINLMTHVASLTASNSGRDTNIFVINNDPLSRNELVLRGANQGGSGSIAIVNFGHLRALGPVSTDTGSILLAANSPLTIDSTVSSTSGLILLTAGATGVTGAGDTLTIGSSGVVKTAGMVVLAAGDNIDPTNLSHVSSGSGQVLQLANLNLSGVNPCLASASLINCLSQVPVSSSPTLVTATSTSTNMIVSITPTTTLLSTTSSSSNALSAGSGSHPADSASDDKASDKTSDAKKDDKKDTVDTKDTGAKKNESAKKMYCN